MDFRVRSADGTSLAVCRTGRGQPLLLVHGSSGGLHSWDPLIPFLADEFELWTFARRGYAPSDVPTGTKSFADDVDDLVAIAATIHDATAHWPTLVGGSYGAWAGLHLGAARPDVVRGMVLFEPPLFAAGVTSRRVLPRYRELLTQQRFGAAARLFSADVARMPVDLLEAAGITGDEPTAPSAEHRRQATGCLHDLEAMADDSADPAQWGLISTLVLLLQGELTWEPMPTAMDDLAAALPADRLMRGTLTGQSHFATHTAPGDFADFVRTAKTF